jgi:hypothetical protein
MIQKNLIQNFFLESICTLIFVYLLTKVNILLNIASLIFTAIKYSLFSEPTSQNLNLLIKIMRFGVDYKDLSLDSLVLLQET